MIDVNELHRLAQAATPGPDGVSLNWIKLLQDFQQSASPAAISELLDRLEAAEKERESWKGLAQQFGNELDTVRAKVEAMEKHEPVAWLHETRRDSDVVTSAVKHVWGKAVVGALAAYSIPLYLAPGAQPAPGVRPAALYPVISWLRNGCDPMKAADELEILAAAPEAKP